MQNLSTLRGAFVRCSIAAFAMTWFSATAGAQSASSSNTRYMITDIGSLNGVGTEAYAINRYGQAVGRAPTPGGTLDDKPYAWHWENGDLLDVGQTTHFGHRFMMYRGECYDVNDNDIIVGGGWNKYSVNNVDYYVITAFVTRPATQTDFVTPFPGDQTSDLGTFVAPTGSNLLTNSVATSISNNNHVVGWADLSYNTNIRAFIVTPLNGQFFVDNDLNSVNDRLLDLGSLAGSAGDSAASAVNDRGEVVGWSATSSGPYHAFIIVPADTNFDGVGDTWSRDTTPANGVNDLLTDLGTLGGTNSWARGINNFGIVVGESDDAFGNTVAFRIIPEDTNGNGVPDRWYRDSNGDGINDLMESLGTLGGNDSSASRLNANGEIVGWAEDVNHNVHAFIYRDGAMYDLNTDTLAASRWVLRQARDINDSGEIVGFGSTRDAAGNTSNHAFQVRIATAEEIAALTDDRSDDTPTDSSGGATGGSSTPATGLPLLSPIEDPAQLSAADGVTAGETASNDSSAPAATSACGFGSSLALALSVVGLIGIKRRSTR